MCWRFQLYCILLIEVLSFSQNMGSLKTSKCACNKPDSQKLFLHFGENGPIGGSKYKQNLFWLREPNCVGTRRTHFACTSNNVGPVVNPAFFGDVSAAKELVASVAHAWVFSFVGPLKYLAHQLQPFSLKITRKNSVMGYNFTNNCYSPKVIRPEIFFPLK